MLPDVDQMVGFFVAHEILNVHDEWCSRQEVQLVPGSLAGAVGGHTILRTDEAIIFEIQCRLCFLPVVQKGLAFPSRHVGGFGFAGEDRAQDWLEDEDVHWDKV